MPDHQPSRDFVGILPAAGMGSRLGPSVCPKELLPVAYVIDGETGRPGPVPVVRLSLRALTAGGVKRGVVTISDRKPELMRYLGDGSEFGLELAYVMQLTPSGLATAVDLAYNWVQNCYSCLVLPDTIVHPTTVMSSLRQVVERENCDLVLGVLPTNVPEQLGPVRFDAEGRVLEVLDKPAATDIRNTWVMAMWSPKFTHLLHESLATPAGTKPALGEFFNLAVQKGMNVKAVWFPQGSFLDIGTVQGLSEMLEWGKNHAGTGT
jgi:glucose-1-phosphate thymidylyltransferase